jgi:hypothetical protein
MGISYVSNVHLNIADADKTSALKILETNGRSKVRISSLHFIPASTSESSLSMSKITLYDSDPSGSGQAFYQERLVSGLSVYFVAAANYASTHNVVDFEPDGLVVDCDDIYVQGSDDGICFVSMNYQGG